MFRLIFYLQIHLNLNVMMEKKAGKAGKPGKTTSFMNGRN